MLISTVNGVRGLGAVYNDQPLLTQNVNFRCDPGMGPAAKACYGVGDTDLVFRSLQAQINRFAGNQFAPLTVDGFIGQNTVAALIIAMKMSPIASGFAVDPGYDLTKEKAAALAVNLINRLRAAADMLSAPQAAPVPVASNVVATGREPGGGLPVSPPGQVATSSGINPTVAATKSSNTAWWIVGAVAVAAVVGVGAALIVRARRRKFGASGHHAMAGLFGKNPYARGGYGDIFPYPY